MTPIYIFLGLVIVGTVVGLIISGKDDAKRMKKLKQAWEEKKNEQKK